MPVDVVLVGAGQRGRHVYGSFAAARPDLLRLVAVVEPDPTRRRMLGEAHDIPTVRRFADHDAALDVAADAWIVASPDRYHHGPAVAALNAGFHVLVEKPMAASAADTADLVARAEASAGMLAVSHVLRYTSLFRTVNGIVASGRLGDVVSVVHRENVVAWHMAHSFVRGNWANASSSTPMIVQKCCHDFDILTWNLPSPVARLSSIGSLFHFHPERAPAGATARCADPCPVEHCPFDARAVYLDEGRTGWPVHVATEDLSPEGRLAALREGPYGRCVYTAGSDVVDHQVVAMELASGASVVLAMVGHSHEEARTMRYDGTAATLRARFGRNSEIEVVDHATGEVDAVQVEAAAGGHGGGDHGLIEAFVAAVRDRAPLPTTAADSLESHLLAFAAEESRLDGAVVDMADYRARYVP